MDYIIAGIYAVAMAFLTRAHGAAVIDEVTGKPTGWPSWGKIAAKIAYALSFAGVNYLLFGNWWLTLLSGALSFFALSTGHGRFFGMQGANPADPNPEFIEKAFGWLYRGDIHKPAYSWFCFGIKGLGIGLAAAPVGVLLAVLWPFSYYASWKIANGTEAAEWLSGLSAALIVIAAIILA